MKRIILFGISMFLLGALSLQAQTWKHKKADQYFERYDYEKAVPLYESLKDKTPEVYRRLAKAYQMQGQLDKAIAYYQHLIETEDYQAEDLYNYAFLLRQLGSYDESARWMEKFAQMKLSDSRGKRFMKDKQYYKKLLQEDASVSLKNVSVNGKNADFGPAYFTDNQIVFTSSRGFGRLWNGNEQPYLDLYVSPVSEDYDLKEMKSFYADVNKKYHDGPASFNQAGDYMILTRNIYGEKVSDNKLWLYESQKQGDAWSTPVALPFNNKDYSCGHASLSADGKRMYFVSDMPGGMGGTDLYFVEKKNDGSWGTPQHLGTNLNTEGNEMFPYFDEQEGYLFYASDGLPGLGGLDIFVAKLKEDGSFSEPVNLGAPINTRFDDFALIYKQNDGFMSSNREGGQGDDDIYAYQNLKKFKDQLRQYYLSGTLKAADNGQALSKVKVKIYKDGKLYKETYTDENGYFKVPVEQGDYTVEAEADAYQPAQQNVTWDQIKASADGQGIAALNLPLVKKQQAPQDICSMEIQPLYYDLDKFYIRDQDKEQLDQLVELLKNHPDKKLEVASHTDSRASKVYNIRLSKNRTMSVIKYLTSHGIDRKRLVAKWYGESRLVNECKDGVQCSEEQHQLNRRTEFKILGCEK